MSYQVIARKWRPQTFEEVTGQESITQTLRNALENDRLHHAYLFSGARGVGKTTTARLLAKALNCHKTTIPNPLPCSFNDPDACPSCKEISESRSIDVLEFDAASHTGVQDIRDIILESINVAPARDRCKVFIIDEVHMLSTSSFNALLKTLEEPPPRVVFIMATTELHKVPETILSRCQEFEFRTIALAKIFERLKLIADAEKIVIADDALREIARSGEGSMRDAQSNFDQVISFSGESIAVKDVSAALGMASVEMLTKVLSAIAEKDAKQILKVVDDLISRGQDLRNFSRDLLSLFRDLLVFKVAGSEESLFETSMLSPDEMRLHAEAFTEADFLRFFNSLSETETKLKDATQSRYVLEIGLIKLIEMRRVVPVEELLEKLAKLQGSSGTMPIADHAEASAAPEKKTLNIRVEPEKPPVFIESKVETPQTSEPETSPKRNDDLPQEPDYFRDAPSSFDDAPEPEPESAPAPPEPSRPAIDLSFLKTIKLSLPDIPAEELEHFDDSWLDNAFDERLKGSGDDLMPMKNAELLVAEALGGGRDKTDQNAQTNGAATAPAREKTVYEIPVFEEEVLPELIPLGEDPSEEEMFAYASNHPAVRRAIRIFRGKIVEVKKL